MVLPEWSDPDRRAHALDRVAADLGRTSRRLTELERRVLVCASHGLSRAMTAEMLDIDPDTVKHRLWVARMKLKAKSTAHAVAVAIRLGMID